MVDPAAVVRHPPRVLALKAALLAVWALAGFVVPWFARDLDVPLGPWPFGYWMAAQGAVLVFIAIVVAYAVLMRRLAPEDSEEDDA